MAANAPAGNGSVGGAGAGVLGSDIGSAVGCVSGATGHTVGTCLQQLLRQMLRQMGLSQVHCSASLVTWLIWAVCIGVCKMYSKVLLCSMTIWGCRCNGQHCTTMVSVVAPGDSSKSLSCCTKCSPC